MNRIGIAGDWHNNAVWAVFCVARFAKHGITEVYHVGDFGIFSHSHGAKYLDAVDEACRNAGLTIYVTPGNHEDYELMGSVLIGAKGLKWIRPRIAIMPRGYRWDVDGRTFVSLGGAASIGFTSQTAGVDWWPEEQITMGDVYEIGVAGPADVMITHEAPLGIDALHEVKAKSGGEWLEVEMYYVYESQRKMTLAVEAVAPKVLFHGHYHAGYQENVLFEDIAGGGFTTCVIGMNMDTQSRNLGIFTPSDYSFEWIKY